MIRQVSLRYFKRFEKQDFELAEHVILAGPNNSGKTTLLQAIVVWALALQKWRERRGPESGSQAKQRTGVPLTRQDFTPLPLRLMDHLWTNTVTGMTKHELREGEKLGKPRVLTITISGDTTGSNWEVAFEFRYQNTELVYVKPTSESIGHLEAAGAAVQVVHVPPFSGIGSAETRYDRPYQDLLIGQGKAGDIIRNLLLEVYERREDGGWDSLRHRIEDVFGYSLLPPEYAGQPHIICQYLKGIPSGKGRAGLPKLDIASSGSGFHQVLLLLAFFYARPSTVLLLDEPDAHLHVVLQKQIYDMLRSLAAERRSQLIVATHAEVLIDATSPQSILSFFREPHRLVERAQRDEVREAIKRLTATDMLRAELSPGVLYVEGESDFNLLRAWARVLGHRVSKWFSDFPFWHDLRGRNPAEAKGHFFALRALGVEQRCGVLVLDGDNRQLEDREVLAEGLVVARWSRYEAESYLLHEEALLRYVRDRSIPLFVPPAREYLRDQVVPVVLANPFEPHDYLVSTPVSKTLLPEFFRHGGIEITKAEYFLVAEQMLPSEIPPEVREKLDLIADTFGVLA